MAGAETLGCYEDNTQNRVLKDHSFDDKTNMTAQVRDSSANCRLACRYGVLLFVILPLGDRSVWKRRSLQ